MSNFRGDRDYDTGPKGFDGPKGFSGPAHGNKGFNSDPVKNEPQFGIFISS
jgi:hypothetical protein